MYRLCILHILDRGTHQPVIVWNLEKAARSKYIADDASFPEKGYQGDFTTISIGINSWRRHVLDKVHLMIEQGGLGYGSRYDVDLCYH